MEQEKKNVNDFIRSQMAGLKVASSSDKVYKDECVVSFDTPYSEHGLYVNLRTFQGFGEEYWRIDHEKTKCGLYLHEVWRQVPIVKTAEEEAAAAPTKLAIGVAGGFMTEKKYETVKTHTLMLVHSAESTEEVALPSSSIPEFVSNVCNAIINHDGMKIRLQASTWVEDQTIVESKYARTLIQLPVAKDAKKISSDPSTWVCQKSGRTDNLWLNLSTGYIGGGRKNWDGTGGSGAALEHFEETGRLYPLCVKLGTITPHGADVWSYADDEDSLVIDPLLAEHLAHWGIDIMQLEKTEKSLGEMEVELNQTYDWSKILESDATLAPLSGPGLKGLHNMGSTCYMNSVLQVLLAMPEVQERYLSARPHIVRTCLTGGSNPCDDFAVQLSKVAQAVLTRTYVQPPAASSASDGAADSTNSVEDLEAYRCTPVSFKNLVGRNHREFSSGRQQDASEYFQHLLDVMQRAERVCLPRLVDGTPQVYNLPNKSTAALFDFVVEKRLQCSVSQQVKYVCNAGSLSNTIELRIPSDHINAAMKVADAAAAASSSSSSAVTDSGAEKQSVEECAKKQRTDDKADAEDEREVTIPFQACLDTFFEDSIVSVRNPTVSTTSNTDAVQSVRLATFPRYLLVKLGRYFVDNSWKQRKISAAIPVPEVLDLSAYRAKGGLQAGEVEMPSDNGAAAAGGAAGGSAAAAADVPIVPDEAVVAQLMSMGFSKNGCERAAVATQRDMGVASAEAAMNWVFAHMEDPDFNDPLPPTGPPAGAPAVPATAETASSGSGSGSGFVADAGGVEMLGAMGFTQEQATAALTSTNNNVERAADWLFSHSNDLDNAVAGVQADAAAAAAGGGTSGADVTSMVYDNGCSDGGGSTGCVYDLFAVVSHMGRNTEHGHYVCHIKKEYPGSGGAAKWVLYNDDKVAESVNPPLKYGFMYVFKRRC